jgi:peptide deformylase
MKKILQSHEKVLRKISKKVILKEIKTPKIQKILKKMSASLKNEYDGVAMAAPQIGYSLRIFIVSGKVLNENLMKNIEEKLLNQNNLVTKKEIKKEEEVKDLVFINPKISKLSREKNWTSEGCLSVRWLYGQTKRSKKALITAYDEKGKKFSRGASGLLAQIFQHETDHLDGILFIDHAKEIREELPTQNQTKI